MIQINLIPEAVWLAQAHRRRVRFWSIALVLAAVTALIPWMIDWQRQARVAELRGENEVQQQDLSSTRTRLRAATAEATSLYLEVQRAGALRSKRSWSGMFALIAASLPLDCWLATVGTDPEAPGVAAPPRAAAPIRPENAPAKQETVTIEAPRKLRIVGYSENDTQPLVFVSNLKDAGVFTDVSLEKAFRAPGPDGQGGAATVYQFEVTCQW